VKSEKKALPCCGYSVDQSDSLEALIDPSKGNSVPKEGDLTICLNCGALLTFTALGNTRPSLQGDLKSLSLQESIDIARAQHLIRARGWIPTEARRRERG